MYALKRQPLLRPADMNLRNIKRSNSSSGEALNSVKGKFPNSRDPNLPKKHGQQRSSSDSSDNYHSSLDPSYKLPTSRPQFVPKQSGSSSSLRYGSHRSITISKQRLTNKEVSSRAVAQDERVSLRAAVSGNTSLRPSVSNEFIASIIEHTTHEVGLAVYNVNTGEIFLSQIIERMTYVQTISTMSRFTPREVIFCSSHESSPLLKKLEGSFSNATFKPVRRSLFDDTRGYRIYCERGNRNKGDLNPENRVMRMLACSALAALLSVIESDLKMNVKYAALHIEWHYPANVLIIDEQTVSDLELFMNTQTNKSANSFLENFRCITCGGTRMLRANLLQPLCDRQAIEDRLDTVFFLIKNPSLCELLKSDIAKFKMLEPISVKFIQQPKPDPRSLKSYIYYILLMSHFISSLDHLRSRLQTWMQEAQPREKRGKALTRLVSCISDPRIDDIRRVIIDNLDTEVLASFENTSRGMKDSYLFVVRQSKITDEQCHISRVTYSQTVEDLSKLCEEYKSKTLMNLRLCSNERRGYFLSCPSSKPEEDLRRISELLHEDIVHISVRDRRDVTFETTRIVSMNNKLRIHEDRILNQSQGVLFSTVQVIQERLELMFEVSYWLSLVDMLLAFSSFVAFYSTVKFCRPVFVKDVDILSYRALSTIWTHERFCKPSQKHSMLSTQLKPVTVYYKGEQTGDFYNRMISTGYVVILSQIGCPVPAESYTACLFNMLLSKLKNNISIENGLSHFQYQVVVLNGLLEANEPSMRALILIDEILKGTNYEQELSISLAFLRCMQEMRGFVITLISDEELIRQIKTAFDYIRVINAFDRPQSVTEACHRMGICEPFAQLVEDYESTRLREDKTLKVNINKQEQYIDALETELLSYFQKKGSQESAHEAQAILEQVTAKLENVLNDRLMSKRTKVEQSFSGMQGFSD